VRRQSRYSFGQKLLVDHGPPQKNAVVDGIRLFRTHPPSGAASGAVRSDRQIRVKALPISSADQPIPDVDHLDASTLGTASAFVSSHRASSDHAVVSRSVPLQTGARPDRRPSGTASALALFTARGVGRHDSAIRAQPVTVLASSHSISVMTTQWVCQLLRLERHRVSVSALCDPSGR
jgi:hypothetical protein